jgi:CheY-like chemotaxis protein
VELFATYLSVTERFHQYVIVAWRKPGPLAKGSIAMNMIASQLVSPDHAFPGTVNAAKQGVVAIVSDNPQTVDQLASVCEFLDLRIEVVSSGVDLEQVLQEHRPMAVVSDVECDEQDGFHTMKVVARYSRDLPIMLLTAGDPVLMGAADAVQSLWGLTSVSNSGGFPMAGQLVQFLFNAGRQAGCMRLIPV